MCECGGLFRMKGHRGERPGGVKQHLSGMEGPSGWRWVSPGSEAGLAVTLSVFVDHDCQSLLMVTTVRVLQLMTSLLSSNKGHSSQAQQPGSSQ